MKNLKKINVAAALDSFKGSLTSREAGEAVRRGVLSRIPDAEVSLCPVGDGGEGTADALCAALCAERRFVTVSDTHGEPVRAEFGLYARDGVRTAVFDLASCCVLRFAKSHGLDYARSTTRGVGEMIRHALDLGCREIAVGLGGSGTGDGGIGALAALGARFTDRGGQEIADPRTKDLGRVAAADLSDLAIPPSVRLTRKRSLSSPGRWSVSPPCATGRLALRFPRFRAPVRRAGSATGSHSRAGRSRRGRRTCSGPWDSPPRLRISIS